MGVFGFEGFACKILSGIYKGSTNGAFIRKGVG